MDITGYIVNSCACYGIEYLGRSINAKRAMITFCRKEMIYDGNSRFRSKSRSEFKQLATFYVFVAGPEVTGKGWTMPWVKYGTEFAQFILENNLGTIATLPKEINFRHHPDTDCQVWIWHPIQENMQDWYIKTIAEQDEICKSVPVELMESTKTAGYLETIAIEKDLSCPHCLAPIYYGDNTYNFVGNYFCKVFGETYNKLLAEMKRKALEAKKKAAAEAKKREEENLICVDTTSS